MPNFLKGLDLSEQYFTQCVRPAMESAFPGLAYAAGLLGDGSEVLGFDTEMSTDHNWGPRVQVFLPGEPKPGLQADMERKLWSLLPAEFLGYPTDLSDRQGRSDSRGVAVLNTGEFLRAELGLSPADEPSALDWLAMPEPKLLGVTAGRVFRDDGSELSATRARFAWYPHDLWLYLMASQWSYISEERAFMGRCGGAGDEIGSRLVAARLVNHLMRLCFLQERRYAPYAKWFGTAFSSLSCAPALQPLLLSVLRAEDWRERERFLSQAYTFVARQHNDLDVTAPLGTGVAGYYSRPFLVIDSDAFAEALLAAVADPVVRAIPRPIGSISHITGCTAILCESGLWGRMAGLYR